MRNSYVASITYAIATALLTATVLATEGLAAGADRTSPMPREQNVKTPDRVQLPSNIIPQHYDLSINPDPIDLKFDGTVRITLDVQEATSEIILNAVDLQIMDASLLASERLSAIVTLNNDLGTANLKFERVIPPGTYDISITYTGKILETADGLFISRYGTPANPKWMLTTQFEPVSARRLLPCFDEPARKATFSVSVTIPKSEVAISNMPVEEVSELDGGRQHVRFQRSPRMSSYLLFLGIGDLERLEMTAGSTKVAVVARKGSAQKGQFALDSAARILEYYNDYFGVPFPLPKLDMIAVPSSGGFSAMENWGAVLYFENALLLDPSLSSESDRQRVFVVVAHELAHQWFGNLVTMEWWDNLWLNEGFASWMENKATDQFHPEWRMWLQSESARQGAMRQDAKRTTHPVVQPVVRGDQANQAFDQITYRKGQAVIRMLENYIGEDAFRQGVRTYMKKYAFQNTVSDDLWAELEKAANKPIKQIADDFTLQPGVPLISVEHASGDGTSTVLNLKQGRFGVDDSADEARVWHIPVSAAAVGSSTTPAAQLVAGPTSGSMQVAGRPPIKINIGQTAYYRSQYASGAFHSLAEHLNLLSPADQLGLLYDTWALGEAGATPIQDYLELSQRVPLDADTAVWRQVIETLVSIDRLYPGLAGRAGFRALARATLKPLFDRTGWDPKSGEPDNTAVLREDLLVALGQFGEPAVIDEARRRFLAFATDPGSLSASIRRPTLRVAAYSADAGLYETMLDLAKKAVDPLEKDQLFVALASAADLNLARRTLDLALSAEPAKTTGPKMIARAALENPDITWAFALDHLDALNERLDALQRINFVPSLGAQSTEPRILGELRQFIDAKVPVELRPQVDRFYADLQFRLKVRAERVPEIDEWLTKNSGITAPRK